MHPEAGLQLPNPAATIGRFLRDRSDPAHRIDPLTAEEEARLLGTARHSYPRHFSLLLCALRTGMRLGELLGLQWGDIDFQGRFIEVRRSLVEGGRIELPKKGKIRRVDLSLLLGETPVAREALGAALDAATTGDKTQRVFLRADRAVPYGELMNAMNALRDAGYLKVALVGMEHGEPK